MGAQDGVLLIGFGAAAGAGFLGLMLALFIGFGCGGSDASEPSDSALCNGPTEDIVLVGGWGLSIGAPLVGMIASLNAGRWWPLWVGCSVAAVDLLVMYAFMNAV